MARLKRRTTDTVIFKTDSASAPLHLDRPGEITRQLEQFVQPQRMARLREVLSRRTQHLTVLIEHVGNPHNVAACIRSCDAFGVQNLHVVTEESRPLPVSLGISKSSHRWVDVYHHPDLPTAIERLRQEGYRIVATCLDSADHPPVPLHELEVQEKTCIVFGNEKSGISSSLRASADALMTIPMQGFMDSLNISVACGVVLQVLRHRRDESMGTCGDFSEEQRVCILDRWMMEEVPRSGRVLHELANRQS